MTTFSSYTRQKGGMDYVQTNGMAVDILSGSTITSSSNSDTIYITPGCRQIDVLIDVLGVVSGTSPTLQFSLNIELVNTAIPAAKSQVGAVKSYAGASLTSGLGTTDYITVGNNVIGDHCTVSWAAGGTSPSFGDVFCRLVFKT